MKKLFFDLLPALAFFIVFRWGESNQEAAFGLVQTWLGWLVADKAVPANAPVLLATALVIVITALQVAWLKSRSQKVEKALWLSFGLVVVLGGITIWLNDELFIKWKPTVLFLLLALGLALGMVWGKNGIRGLLGAKLSLPEFVWRRLLWAWVGFLLFNAGLNLFVVYSFSTATWVNYKLFGTTFLMFLFVILQSLYLGRYMVEPVASSVTDEKAV